MGYKHGSSAPRGLHFSGQRAVLPFLNVFATGAVANNIMRSHDGGVTWLACVAPNPGAAAWWGAAYSDSLGYAIATSAQGIVVRSFDGITWTALADDLTNGNWRRMVRNLQDTLFVVVGIGGVAGQRVATSPDGITWTLRATPNGPQSTSWTDICVNPVTGRIWCLTSAAFLQPFIFSDDGGITWAYGNALGGNDGGIRMIGADLGLANGYLRFTGGGTVDVGDYFSTDNGATWQFVDSNPGAGSQGTALAINELAGSPRVIRGNAAAPGLIRAAPFDFPNPWTTVDNARTMANPSFASWQEAWQAWVMATTTGQIYRSVDPLGATGTWSTNATGLLNGNSTNILASPFAL